MSELKPCPFCGETVSLDNSELLNKKHWYITCDYCGMMYQAVVCQRKDTKTGWNNRPIEDELTARIAELEEECASLGVRLHDEMSQLEIATDLGNKRWLALNDIYENGEKHNANWCKRKAREGLGIK